MDREIQFGTLMPDGSLTNQRSIKRSDIAKCPHFILVADHYYLNGGCKCYDRNEKIMEEWGYTWDEDTGRWE